MVSGAQAKARGFAGADPAASYIAVNLARPVPADGGQARLRIVKTYKDDKSYYRNGDAPGFKPTVRAPRAAVLLPARHPGAECSGPAEVLSEPDGRIRVSFMNQMPGSAALLLRARSGAPTGDAAKPRPLSNARSWESPAAQGPTERARLTERAHQDRDIVY